MRLPHHHRTRPKGGMARPRLVRARTCPPVCRPSVVARQPHVRAQCQHRGRMRRSQRLIVREASLEWSPRGTREARPRVRSCRASSSCAGGDSMSEWTECNWGSRLGGGAAGRSGGWSVSGVGPATRRAPPASARGNGPAPETRPHRPRYPGFRCSGRYPACTPTSP